MLLFSVVFLFEHLDLLVISVCFVVCFVCCRVFVCSCLCSYIVFGMVLIACCFFVFFLLRVCVVSLLFESVFV